MARTNGGIIGKANLSSFEGGLGSTTTKNSSGNITVQPGTRRVQALIVAGGGGGGNSSPLAGGMGGGGAGGYRCVEIDLSRWNYSCYCRRWWCWWKRSPTSLLWWRRAWR